MLADNIAFSQLNPLFKMWSRLAEFNCFAKCQEISVSFNSILSIRSPSTTLPSSFSLTVSFYILQIEVYSLGFVFAQKYQCLCARHGENIFFPAPPTHTEYQWIYCAFDIETTKVQCDFLLT